MAELEFIHRCLIPERVLLSSRRRASGHEVGLAVASTGPGQSLKVSQREEPRVPSEVTTTSGGRAGLGSRRSWGLDVFCA